ncbi:helicase-exonuclease AddAB subunit AddA [Paenibacillus sp. N1-5-1-14]|uniref:helicase-exonuclease AddAB subunit AddA n=1 Tax=Paenibacillus radicibacter TaxID=2972488 RepID=UPI002158B92E|nr:helicase-exonuclease AddAB subunit AddA [Paenibacillus radicibacter]MCR8645678.1 helicase-exonuclease AddAB subunit AddA [Paenibacillus radicibacter]
MTLDANKIIMQTAPVKPEGSTWTDEQWEAIARRGSDLLVAAAAGSGKTAVLVERIIGRISSEDAPVDVDRLLVATFTKAAAAEMKERIREALERKLEDNPQSEHLRKQLALMGRASVTTLHSFCLEVIQRYYSLIGLDPGFRIANETEGDLLRQDVMEDMLEQYYEQSADDAPFWQLVDGFGGERGDGPLIELIEKLYEISRSQPWPEHWLTETAAMFGGQQDGIRSDGGLNDEVAELASMSSDAEEDRWVTESTGSTEAAIDDRLSCDKAALRLWQESLLPIVRLELEGAAELFAQALRIAEIPSGPEPYAETFREELSEVRELIAYSSQSWLKVQELLSQIPSRRLKPCRGDSIDTELKEQASDLRKKAKTALDKLRTELFSRSEDEYAEEVRLLAPMLRTLSALVVDFGQRYQAAKADKGLLDFGDLEHYTLQILRDPSSSPTHTVPSQAALEYRAQFVEVLIDEYQDTNRVQEAILDLISNTSPGNRFMVGDVKQSIYKFRLAEPGLFLDKYKAFSTGASEDGVKIDLARNFRSRLEVVDAVNFVFRQLMNERVGEISYDVDAELIHGATYPNADQDFAVHVTLIDRSSDGSGGDEALDTEEAADSAESQSGDGAESESPFAEAQELATAEAEARTIARQIHELLNPESGKPFMVYDKQSKGMREATYRDIVILMRATSSWAPTFMEELQTQGIPAYADLSSGYFSATEVEVMISLLKIIDNPYQDVPLAAVLRSPLVGLTADELALIRINGGKKISFYDTLRAAAVIEDMDDEATASALQAKLVHILAKLNEWRTAARRGSLAELIWNIYRETGFYDFVGGMPHGGQRQANLRALYDRAKQYESTSLRGLFRFLRFIKRMQDSGGDLGTARALGEGENVVRIISIHKSKGLEFPIVFVAGIAKMFNQRDLNEAFLVHKELGFGPRFLDTELRVAYPTLPLLAIRRAMKLETLAEEMRVLYVALTRAREKLYLVGTVKDAVKQMKDWSRLVEHKPWNLPDNDLAKAKSYLDWLGPALMRHQDASMWREAAEYGFDRLTGDVANDRSKWTFEIKALHALFEVSNEVVDPTVGDPFLTAVKEGRPVDVHQTFAEADEARADVVEEQALVTSEVSLDLVELNTSHEVRQRLEWQYAHPFAQTYFGKTTVSEMKRVGEEKRLALAGEMPDARLEWKPSSLLRRPRFLEERKMTSAERGTVYHAVMQNLPLEGEVPDEQLVEHTLARMVEREMLTSVQCEAVDAAMIVSFFQTEVGKRLLKASIIRREVPFSYGLRAGEVYGEADPITAQETVLIQGVIDCLFEDEEGLVLLDYKTDRTHGKTLEDLAKQYQVQMDLYARAIEHIYRKPLERKYLYYFEGQILVDLDEALKNVE